MRQIGVQHPVPLFTKGFPGGSDGKEFACKDPGSIPGTGRSHGEGNGRMATHYSILASRIPQTEEPGGLQSIGILRNKVYGSLAFKTGEGNGTPLQHSCLENPMDGGAWRATVHRVAESNTTEQLTLSLSLPLFIGSS